MDQDYKLREQENLRNPKNRWLGICCHAKVVDNAWGCDWSFQCGVITFSIVIFVCTVFDVYAIAYVEVFKNSGNGFLNFCYGVKVFADVINFCLIIFACYAVFRRHLKFSIISYYVCCVSLIITTLFMIYNFFALFWFTSYVWREMIAVLFLDVGLFFYSWILFCNQVDLGRQAKAAASAPPY